MHEQFANGFYRSRAWRRCRDDFAKARGGLCERCLSRGIINPGTDELPLQVHHKVKLTPQNITDPAIALNWDNLELLCKRCHDDERAGAPVRWTVDEMGHVVAR